MKLTFADIAGLTSARCRVASCRVSNAPVPIIPSSSSTRSTRWVAAGAAIPPARCLRYLIPPGVATGLAWTPQGVVILFIESSLMPGTGQLTLTGQLGDAMKESARIALSLLRAHLPTMVPWFDYAQKDIHVHVPAGAIPKDGPSAGVTMLTSLASLFTGRRVSPKLAMTDEITLRGVVTPVGGIKEKVLAAHRAGIETVLMARRNEKDLRDVPADIRAQLKFELVDTIDDVLRIALSLERDQGLVTDVTSLGSVATPPASHA